MDTQSKYGFLPADDPLQQLPTAFDAWENAAKELPKLLLGYDIRTTLSDLPPFPSEKLTTETQFERAMLILSYLGHAYVWADTHNPATHLPENLAKPWYAVANKLGRPPILSYASYALYNWKRFDTKKPIELGNIALLQNFLSGIDEEWFILIHVDIEAKAIPMIQALSSAQQAAINNDPGVLIQNLQTIIKSLSNICAILKRMPEHCDPYIYYNRVRPYIHGWKHNPALPNGLVYEGVKEYQNKPQKFKGETGAQSTIIPALDSTLGILHADNPLKQHLIEMQTYMPPKHRILLKTLDSKPPVRDYILKHDQQEKNLRELYNKCIELISDFRSTHFQYATQYIQKQSQTSNANPTEIGTGGTPFITYLKKHRDETEDFLI